MKKNFAVFMIILSLFCTACGPEADAPDSKALPEPEVTAAPAPTAEATPSPEPVEEIVEIKPLKAGTYTFYNSEAGLYLSCQDGALILSKTPANWTLKEVSKGAFNICAPDSELLLDIDNAWVKQGTKIKLWRLTGYDVQIWNLVANADGSYSISYSGDNQYCLGFSNGEAQLQLRDTNNGTQEWEAVDISDTLPKEYLSYQSLNGVIELQLPLDILSVISEERLMQWANELEMMYDTYYELTGFIPYETIIVEAYKPCEYFAYVIDYSNVIHFNNKYIYSEMEKMAARDCDWNFCVLHEMGHMFDRQRPWNFESEVMTDFKLAYVLETNNAAAAPAEFPASEVFYGADIANAYEHLGRDFSAQYDIFSIAKRFLDIKDEIGWDPFLYTFHYMQENEAAYANATKLERLENFVALLSQASGKDIKAYFSPDEWNTIINKISA